jgi:hypothetical protein
MSDEIIRRGRQTLRQLRLLSGHINEEVFVCALARQGYPEDLVRRRLTVLYHAFGLAQSVRDGNSTPAQARRWLEIYWENQCEGEPPEVIPDGPMTPLDPTGNLAERYLHECWLDMFGDDATDSPAILPADPAVPTGPGAPAATPAEELPRKTGRPAQPQEIQDFILDQKRQRVSHKEIRRRCVEKFGCKDLPVAGKPFSQLIYRLRHPAPKKPKE